MALFCKRSRSVFSYAARELFVLRRKGFRFVIVHGSHEKQRQYQDRSLTRMLDCEGTSRSSTPRVSNGNRSIMVANRVANPIGSLGVQYYDRLRHSHSCFAEGSKRNIQFYLDYTTPKKEDEAK